MATLVALALSCTTPCLILPKHQQSLRQSAQSGEDAGNRAIPLPLTPTKVLLIVPPLGEVRWASVRHDRGHEWRGACGW
jgi:hypothetical protein